MARRWLISLEYYAVFFRPDGSSDRIGPKHSIEIIDIDPVLYVAQAREKYHRRANNPPQHHGDTDARADDISAIFFAREIPDGLLTEEQIDRLS